MPLNYQDIEEQKRKELDNLVTDQESYLKGLKTNQDTLPVDSLSASGAPMDVMGQKASLREQLPQFQRAQQSKLNKSVYGRNNSLLGVRYNLAYQKAKDMGLREQEAVSFARQYSNQVNAENYQAGEAEKERANKVYLNSLADKYSKQGVELNNQYANQTTDPTGALLGMILGTGTAIGTNAYLKKLSDAEYAKKFQDYKDFWNSYGGSSKNVTPTIDSLDMYGSGFSNNMA